MSEPESGYRPRRALENLAEDLADERLDDSFVDAPTAEPNAPSASPEDVAETDPAADGKLTTKAVRGAAVTVAAQGTKIFLQLLSVVVLGRLLGATDYGLIASVTTVIGVADIFRDFGLSSAAIQAKTLSRKQRDNLFWLNTGLGVILTLIIMAASPLIASLFKSSPHVHDELVNLTLAIAPVFVISGMATQYRADLTRRMRFRNLAVADVLAPVVALAVAVVLALLGARYWALAAQQLVQMGVMFLAVVIQAGWLPRRYHRDEPMKHLMNFGWKLAGSQVVTYIGSNIDNFSIGRWIGMGPLGVYSRSYQFVMTPLGQIRGPLNTVAIPLLSRMQDDEERYQDYVVRGQVAMGYTLVVGLAIAAGASTPLVAVALGAKWAAAAPLLRLLCLAGSFTTLSYVGYWVYITKGLVDHLFQYSFVSTAIRIACVLVGVQWGVVGVATGMAVSPLIAWPLSFWWLSRRASIPVRRLWLGGMRIVAVAGVIGLASGVVSWLLRSQASVLALLAAVAASLVVYGLLFLVIPQVRRDVLSIRDLVKTGLRR